MTQANDSITVTPGTGATVATHLASGKEHQVVMLASASGQLEGSLPSYWLTVQDQNTNSSQVFFDLWNGSGSNIIRIRGIWINSGVDVANNSAIGTRLDYVRTSTVGTGGTTAGYNSATIGTANIVPKDSTNAALPAGVSARFAPTGGGTASAWLFSLYASTEELTLPSYTQQFENCLPEPMRGAQEFILNPSQGIKVIQGSNDSAGTLGFFVEFTVE